MDVGTDTPGVSINDIMTMSGQAASDFVTAETAKLTRHDGAAAPPHGGRRSSSCSTRGPREGAGSEDKEGNNEHE